MKRELTCASTINIMAHEAKNISSDRNISSQKLTCPGKSQIWNLINEHSDTSVCVWSINTEKKLREHTVLFYFMSAFQKKCFIRSHFMKHHFLNGWLATPVSNVYFCHDIQFSFYLLRPIRSIFGFSPTSLSMWGAFWSRVSGPRPYSKSAEYCGRKPPTSAYPRFSWSMTGNRYRWLVTLEKWENTKKSHRMRMRKQSIRSSTFLW